MPKIPESSRKLEIFAVRKAKTRHDGTVVGQCPACAAGGADKSGEHLIIYPDGRWGCVANPGPEGRAHRKEIFRLIGERKGKSARSWKSFRTVGWVRE